MQRIALVFTVIVFAALAGGLLSRHAPSDPVPLEHFEPDSAPIFAPLVDPLDVARAASSRRADRLELRLVDPDGKPVAEAALVVRASGSAIWAFSDAEGRAVLEGLSPGNSRLAILAFPHPAMELDIAPAEAERLVSLAPASTMPPPLPDIPRSGFAGRLDLPAPGAPAAYQVLLLPRENPSELGGALPRAASCDAAGGFAFEGLAHGNYRLQVLPAWAAGGTWPDLAAPAQRELEHASEISDAVIALEVGSIEGEVLDDQGRPLEGALVHALDLAREGHYWPAVSCGARGRFQIGDLPPGTYRVDCRAGEGSSSVQVVVGAGAASRALVPPFAARRRP